MTDIVERLRSPEQYPPQTLMAEAADEIEQLRTALDDLGFDLNDYCKIAAALWAVQAKEGTAHTRRIVESVMRVLSEAGIGKSE